MVFWEICVGVVIIYFLLLITYKIIIIRKTKQNIKNLQNWAEADGLEFKYELRSPKILDSGQPTRLYLTKKDLEQDLKTSFILIPLSNGIGYFTSYLSEVSLSRFTFGGAVPANSKNFQSFINNIFPTLSSQNIFKGEEEPKLTLTLTGKKLKDFFKHYGNEEFLNKYNIKRLSLNLQYNIYSPSELDSKLDYLYFSGKKFISTREEFLELINFLKELHSRYTNNF